MCEQPIILGASIVGCRPDEAIFRDILVDLARHVDWERDEAEEGRHAQEAGKAPLKPEHNATMMQCATILFIELQNT